MQRQTRRYILLAIALLALTVAFAVRYSRKNAETAVQPHRTGIQVFNTTATVTLYGPLSPELLHAIQEWMTEMQRLHVLLNAHAEDSEVSRLNQQAATAPFRCSDTLWELLMESQSAWKLSNGCFDPTVGPLMRLWGFYAKRDKIPTEEQLQAARQCVGFDKLQFDSVQHTVQFTQPSMSLDFGGIAKGYALQKSIDIFKKHTNRPFVIDLGGNIYASASGTGHPMPFSIGIRNPHKPADILDVVTLSDQCVATSGSYERYRIIQGQSFSHIIDPRTARPVPATVGYQSVSVITKHPVLSDVLSTTAFVAGKDVARQLENTIPYTTFLFR